MRTRFKTIPISIQIGQDSYDLYAEVQFTYNPGEKETFDNEEDPEKIDIESISVNGVDFYHIIFGDAMVSLEDEILMSIHHDKEQDEI